MSRVAPGYQKTCEDKLSLMSTTRMSKPSGSISANRSYDVTDRLGAARQRGGTRSAARLGARTKAFIITDDNVGARHLATIAGPLEAEGPPARQPVPAGRRGDEVVRVSCRPSPREKLLGCRRRARRLRHRTRWRCHWRPRRVRGGDPATRRALRPGADLAARPGRFLRRRQNRDQHAPTART